MSFTSSKYFPGKLGGDGESSGSKEGHHRNVSDSVAGALCFLIQCLHNIASCDRLCVCTNVFKISLSFKVEAHYKGSASEMPSRLQLVLLTPSSSSSSTSPRSLRNLLPSCAAQAPAPGARYLLMLGTSSLAMGSKPKLFLTSPPTLVGKGTLARVKKLTCPSCGE